MNLGPAGHVPYLDAISCPNSPPPVAIVTENDTGGKISNDRKSMDFRCNFALHSRTVPSTEDPANVLPSGLMTMLSRSTGTVHRFFSVDASRRSTPYHQLFDDTPIPPGTRRANILLSGPKAIDAEPGGRPCA